MFLARYTPAGTLDTTFNSSGTLPGAAYLYVGPQTTGYGVAVAAKNKMTVVGSATINNAANNQYIARFNANGSLDTTLTPEDFIITSLFYNPLAFVGYTSYFGYGLIVQNDGKLLTCGQVHPQNFCGLSRYLCGSIPFSPTLAIATYGQNSDYILDFLPVSFYAQVITDANAQAATIAAMNTIIADYAADYVNQPNFNYMSYLYLVESELNQAQADLVFSYPNSTSQINLFFSYINKQIATLAV